MIVLYMSLCNILYWDALNAVSLKVSLKYLRGQPYPPPLFTKDLLPLISYPVIWDPFSMNQVFVSAGLIKFLMLNFSLSNWYIWKAAPAHGQPAARRIVSHHDLSTNTNLTVATEKKISQSLFIKILLNN